METLTEGGRALFRPPIGVKAISTLNGGERVPFQVVVKMSRQRVRAHRCRADLILSRARRVGSVRVCAGHDHAVINLW